MTPDTVHDSTRVVVEGMRRGSVLPGNRAEMWRDVYLVPRSEVRGGIWGNRLFVDGPSVRVEQSVYVRGEVRVRQVAIEGSTRRGVTFGSCVTCGGSLHVEDASFRTRFLSNIYAGVVSLQNSVVYGNVYARKAVLRDCVVMGGVFCHEGLVLENCVVATFRAQSVRLGESVFMLFPVALSEQPIVVTHPVRAVPFFQLGTAASAKGRVGGVVELDQDDVYRIRVGDALEGPGEVYALSLDQRLSDGSGVVETFLKNREMVEYLSLSDHFPDAERAKLRGPALTECEKHLMGLLRARDLPTITGGTSLQDLAKSAEVVASVRRVLGDQSADALALAAQDADAFSATRRMAEVAPTGGLPPASRELFAYGDEPDWT